MVCWEPPKRTLRVLEADDSAQVTDVPNEVLYNIMESLSRQDVLNMRLTCCDFFSPATQVIQDRLKCLYIHPSTSSLLRVSKICAHPRFRQEIREVVLLGHITYEEISKRDSILSNVVMESLRLDPGGFIPMFLPWQSTLPKSQDWNLQTESIRHLGGRSLKRVLCQSITNLPKLESICFTDRVREPGFNQPSRAKIDSYPKENFGDTIMNRCERVSDASMLFSFDQKIRKSVSRLVLNRPPPFLGIPLNGFSFANLRSLAFRLDHGGFDYLCSDNRKSYMECCDHLIQKNKRHLEELQITLAIEDTSWNFLPDPDSALVNLFDNRLPKLKHISIVQVPDRSYPGCSQRPLSVDSRGPRSVLKFFQKHAAASLESVVIENILFFDKPDLEPTPAGEALSALGTFEAILNTLRSKDVKVQYLIHRFAHSANCMRDVVPDGFDGCEFACGKYRVGQPKSSLGPVAPYPTMHDFDEYALSRGVELKQHADGSAAWWDFGEKPEVSKELQNKEQE